MARAVSEVEIPSGYLSIDQCVQWCMLERQGKQEAFRQALRKSRSVAEASTTVGSSRFTGANTGFNAATILRNALVSGHLVAAAIREADGVLIAMPTSLWRRPMNGTSPFDEALDGRPVPVGVAPDGAVTAIGAPLVARLDLERWAGTPEAQVPSAPTETPLKEDRSDASTRVGEGPDAEGRTKTRGLGRGGKSVAREVAAAITALGAKLAAEGVPARGDGGQATLERWFLEKVERNGGKLSESRVRAHVRRAIAAYREAVERG